ncbi:MAG: hypothetical protein WBA76_22435 [Phormidesmis sp.]
MRNGAYVERDRPPTFPMIKKSDLYSFLQEAVLNEVSAEINFRRWVREQLAA